MAQGGPKMAPKDGGSGSATPFLMDRKAGHRPGRCFPLVFQCFFEPARSRSARVGGGADGHGHRPGETFPYTRRALRSSMGVRVGVPPPRVLPGAGPIDMIYNYVLKKGLKTGSDTPWAQGPANYLKMNDNKANQRKIKKTCKDLRNI